ncbi:flagellar protein FlgN [Thalassobacillus sp. CUG 92003]|uniref:flagellar protein FlgN n=1 Tax=Thalassobacillus sp. CUG 92003 TaxID=2736641 RepID=UPI0015E7073D|nr:flagellar protein FlgN [Thalassobacillus sp. CUG 92003]
MSLHAVIQLMEKQKQLHESLLTLSQQKTEILKQGEHENFQALLAKERKHVQAIETVEKQRMQAVSSWYDEQGIRSEDPTVSEMLTLIDNEWEREELQRIFDAFIFVMSDLRKQEKLNAELTQQSLQFINVSLDMLQPSLKNMNYGKPSQDSDKNQKRSVFDSKA